MKKIFFNICYISTIITLINLLVFFLLFVFASSFLSENVIFNQLFFNNIVMIFRLVFELLLFILLIKCFIVWSKRDRNVIRFFFLLFLHGFYILYYYPKIIKNSWL